jgi:hypothetical protein
MTKKRTKWNEYIDGMEGNRLVSKVRDWMPKKWRILGRPNTRWKDTVKQED